MLKKIDLDRIQLDQILQSKGALFYHMDNLLDFTTLFLDTLLPAFYKNKYKILIFFGTRIACKQAGDFLDPAPMN